MANDERNPLTYMDLGHHNLNCLLSATPRVFGQRVVLIRFRRARLETVYSFMSSRKNKNVCHRPYTICPDGGWMNGGGMKYEVILKPKNSEWWENDAWNQLGIQGQNFWYIDEV